MTKNLNEFITKFQKNHQYYWKSSLKNAQYIFFFLQKEKNFENVIFNYKIPFDDDLVFLDKEAIELVKNFQDFEKNQQISVLLSTNSKNKILENFNKHIISKWSFDEILFSTGVYCCISELKLNKVPSVHFFLSMFYFLLNNNLAFQFYYFLKNNNIFLQYKKKAIVTIISELEEMQYCSDLNLDKFLENFILIWDLFGYKKSRYFELKKKINKPSDIAYIVFALKEKIYIKE